MSDTDTSGVIGRVKCLLGIHYWRQAAPSEYGGVYRCAREECDAWMHDARVYDEPPRDRDREIRTDGGEQEGSTAYWDGEDCPRNECEGELQQQDWLNVSCLECGHGWTHEKNEREHWLANAREEIVTRRSRATSDGGESA